MSQTTLQPSPRTSFHLPSLQRPAGYGMALAWVIAALLVVPLLFAAIFGLFAYLSIWHLYQSIVWLQQGPYFIFHLPMALIGLVLLTMLLKPLFLRGKEDGSPAIPLLQSEQPKLFALVEQLCDAAAAPRPSCIEVDCDPNASVRFVGGFKSLLQRKLTLRIGLPLVAGLPVDQFAGVLAHEFGHFNQRSGMGGSMLVRWITASLARIVFGRDKVDRFLTRLGRSRYPLAKLIYWFTWLFVEPARGVLWLMMMVCQILSCRLLRKMEFDADGQEAQLAGSEKFVQTTEQILLLSVATHAAHDQLADQFERQRLADNLPSMIVGQSGTVAERQAKVLAMLRNEPGHWYDTHPSFVERRAHARGLSLPGVFENVKPATKLFNNFERLCREASLMEYRRRVGDKLLKVELVPTEPLVTEMTAEAAAMRELRIYYRGAVLASGTTSTAIAVPRDLDAAIEELFAARAALLDCGDGGADATRQRITAEEVIRILQARLRVLEQFSRNRRIKKVVKPLLAELARQKTERSSATQELESIEAAGQRRLAAALSIGLSPAFASRVGSQGEKIAAEIRKWSDVLATLADMKIAAERLRDAALIIQSGLAFHDERRPVRGLVSLILENSSLIRRSLEELRGVSLGKAYPFAHGSGQIAIHAALFDELPMPKDPVKAMQVALAAQERYAVLCFRSMAQLTALASRIEHLAGLEPLADARPLTEIKLPISKEARKKARRYWIGFGSRATLGTALLTALAWFSLFPPDLPTMGWGESNGPSGYRPASFSLASVGYTPTSTIDNAPRVYRGPSALYRTGVSPDLPMMPVPAMPSADVGAMVDARGMPVMPSAFAHVPHSPPMPSFPPPGQNLQPGYRPQPGYPPQRPSMPQPYMPQPQRFSPGFGPQGGGRPGGGGFHR